jgi:hypothetical protein
VADNGSSARTRTEDAMSEYFSYQVAPHAALGQFVELPPYTAFAQEEKFILGQVRPWNAENPLSPFADSARIDQAVADGSRKSGFDQAHGSSRFLKWEINRRIIKSSAVI